MSEGPNESGSTEKQLSRRVFHSIVYSGALYTLLTQAAHWGDRLVNRCKPSFERAKFQAEYGVDLIGRREDIENGTNGYYPAIKQALDAARCTGKPMPRSITVVSPTIPLQSIGDQIRFVCTDVWRGPRKTSVTRNGDVVIYSDKTFHSDDLLYEMHHELAHIAEAKVSRQHPEFLQRWSALAKHPDGRSLYGDDKQVMYTYQGDVCLMDGRSVDPTQFGFVSGKATQNVYEDVACTVAMAEVNPKFYNSSFLRGRYECSTGKTIPAKTRLAQDFGLLPMEYTEAVALLWQSVKMETQCRQYHDVAQRADDMHSLQYQIETFVKKYPQSIFTCRFHKILASIALGYTDSVKDTTKDATSVTTWGAIGVDHAYRALTASFTPQDEYEGALLIAERLHRRTLEDSQTADIFAAACRYYKDSCMQKAAYGDVNAFLQSQGVRLHSGETRVSHQKPTKHL